MSVIGPFELLVLAGLLLAGIGIPVAIVVIVLFVSKGKRSDGNDDDRP